MPHISVSSSPVRLGYGRNAIASWGRRLWGRGRPWSCNDAHPPGIRLRLPGTRFRGPVKTETFGDTGWAPGKCNGKRRGAPVTRALRSARPWRRRRRYATAQTAAAVTRVYTCNNTRVRVTSTACRFRVKWRVRGIRLTLAPFARVTFKYFTADLCVLDGTSPFPVRVALGGISAALRCPVSKKVDKKKLRNYA